eukprot:2830120-Pyramimonas_sp.AAC.1
MAVSAHIISRQPKAVAGAHPSPSEQCAKAPPLMLRIRCRGRMRAATFGGIARDACHTKLGSGLERSRR